MSAHRYQAAFRAITFNRLYDNTGLVDDPAHMVAAYARSDYRLLSFDINRVETTDYRELRQWLEGAEGNEAYESVLVARGGGIIYGTDHGDLEDKTAAMRDQFSVASCRLAAASADPVGVLPFTFRRDTAGGNLQLQLFCRPTSGRPTIVTHAREGLTRRFQFTLTAFDPAIYSQTETTTGLTVNGTAAVTNAGTRYTQPKYVFVNAGAATFVLKVNGTAAVTFTAVPAGTWTIDTKRGTITNASGTNGYQYRTSGYISNGLLSSGANSVDLTGSSGLSSATCVYRDAWS